jgi:hypothetical protein
VRCSGPQEPNDPELPRLGLTVVRYNLGASPTDSSVLPAFCPSLRPGAAVPSPAQTPFPAGQFDPASLNLNADQRQIQILKQARDFIAQTSERPTLEAFANSPPWWMNVNQCASGDSEPPTIIAMANELGAQVVWYQSGRVAGGAVDPAGCWLPEEASRYARGLVESAGLRFVGDVYIADSVRRLHAGA